MKKELNSNQNTKKNFTVLFAQSNDKTAKNEFNQSQKTQEGIQTQNMSSQNQLNSKNQQQNDVFSIHQERNFNNFLQQSDCDDSDLNFLNLPFRANLLNSPFRQEGNHLTGKEVYFNKAEKNNADFQDQNQFFQQKQEFRQQFYLLKPPFGQEVYFNEGEENEADFQDQNQFLQQQQNSFQQIEQTQQPNDLKKIRGELIKILQNLLSYKQNPYFKEEIYPLIKQFQSRKLNSQVQNKSKSKMTHLKKNCFRDISRWIFKLLKQKVPNEFNEVQEFIMRRNKQRNKAISDLTKTGSFQKTFYQSMKNESLEFCIKVKEIMDSISLKQKISEHRYIKKNGQGLQLYLQKLEQCVKNMMRIIQTKKKQMKL